MVEQHRVVEFTDSATDDIFFKIWVPSKRRDGYPNTPVARQPLDLRVIYTGGVYKLETSCGKLKKNRSGVRQIIGGYTPAEGLIDPENHVFSYTKESELEYPPVEQVSLDWVCRQKTIKPVLEGRKIYFDEPQLGVIKASYSYEYDEWVLYGVNLPVQVVVGVKDKDDNVLGTLSISFQSPPNEEDEEVKKGGITIRWLDRDTDEPISSGEVWIGVNGGPQEYKGNTDSNGCLNLTSFPTGTHSISFVHSAYMDTESDSIGTNDQFTINEEDLE